MEGGKAIEQAALTIQDTSFMRLYFDVPEYHDRLHQALLDETYETLTAAPERFFLIETEGGYAVWDDIREEIYADPDGVTEEFTSEWQAEDYLAQVKKDVAERDAADWLRVEMAKSGALEEPEVRQEQPAVEPVPDAGAGQMRTVETLEDLQEGTAPASPETAGKSVTDSPAPQEPAYRVGDTVYLDNTAFIVEQIGEYDVQIRDPTLAYPIFRSEGRERLEGMLWADARNAKYLPGAEVVTATPNYEITVTADEAPVLEERLADAGIGTAKFVQEGGDVTFSFAESDRDAVEGLAAGVISESGAERPGQEPTEPTSTTFVSKLEPEVTSTTETIYPGDRNGLPFDVVIEKLHIGEPEHTEPEQQPKQPQQPAAHNFRITDDHLGEGGPKAKFRANMDAINLLHELEFDGRDATPEEQEVLSRYVGWGGLADAFDEKKDSWANEFRELYAALSPEEYAAARASTLNAHYTSPTVIKAIYDAVGQMGFQTGNILEPSMGVGNFFGLLPESMQGSRLYGVEPDSITGRIAQKLYPAVLWLLSPAAIRWTPKAPTPGNISRRGRSCWGAIRLPNNAFKANAGTEVVSDILFLQKRNRPIDIEPDWVHLGRTPEGLTINSYFTDHPEMVLGELTTESTQYGREECTVRPVPGADLSELFQKAVSHIQGQYQAAELDAADIAEAAVDRGAIPADPDVKNFSYALVDGEVYFRENSVMKPVELSDAAKGRVAGMVGLRQIVNDLIGYQLEDYPDGDIQAKQAELNAAYDAFYAKYGTINSSANARVFDDDSSYYLLCSLENIDEDGRLASKADMFTKCTIRSERHVTSVDTPSEALAVSIGERGRVDLQFMSGLLGTPGEYERITEELRGVIFRDPREASADDPLRGWHTADDYLSGNVRDKLAVARMAAANVAVLEKAQPKDLDASEIDVRLGATWIDKDYIQQFMEETFETPWRLRNAVEVKYSPATAEWQVTGKNATGRHDVMAYMTYGTDRAGAYRILEDTLNLRDVRIYDTIEDADGKQKRVLNKKEATLAQQKQQAIKDAFRDWVWRAPRRREDLVRIYNELFNSTRPREYDGSHIVFGGMNPDITLREHKRGAIAHVLYGGNTLLAHEVGAGKSATRS